MEILQIIIKNPVNKSLIAFEIQGFLQKNVVLST